MIVRIRTELHKNYAPWTYFQIKHLAEEKGLSLLSKYKSYITHETKFKCKCTCGSEFEIALPGLKAREGHKCLHCNKIPAKKNTTPIGTIKKLLHARNYECLSKNYKRGNKIKYSCNCGYVGYCFLEQLKKNKHLCPICKWKSKSRISFVVYKEILELKYPSIQVIGAPSFNNRKVKHLCKLCGYVWERSPYKRLAKSCPICHSKESFYDSENYGKRQNRKVVKWRKKIYEKDNFMCVACGNPDYLNAHHIYTWKDNPLLRKSLSNGITLDVDCHREFHRIYGRSNNTLDQINRFLFIKNSPFRKDFIRKHKYLIGDRIFKLVLFKLQDLDPDNPKLLEISQDKVLSPFLN